MYGFCACKIAALTIRAFGIPSQIQCGTGSELVLKQPLAMNSSADVFVTGLGLGNPQAGLEYRCGYCVEIPR